MVSDQLELDLDQSRLLRNEMSARMLDRENVIVHYYYELA